MVNKVLEATPETPTTWQYQPFNGYIMGIRPTPSHTAEGSDEEFLKPGEIFQVSQEKRGYKGAVYLKLADGRGWVWDRNTGGLLCKRKVRDLRKASEVALQ